MSLSTVSLDTQNHLLKQGLAHVETLKSYVGASLGATQETIPSFAIAITGSDARLERVGSLSEVELILIESSDLTVELQQKVAKRVDELVHQGSSPFRSDLEVKRIPQDEVATFKNKNGLSIAMPTRALDARLLEGDKALFCQYKVQLREELLKGQKTIVSEFRLKRYIIARNLLHAQIKKTKTEGVDCQNGRLYFEERSDGKEFRGPKHGMLRSIQYVVAYVFCKTIGNFSNEEIMQLPPSICARIDLLQQKKLISLPETERVDLRNTYLLGLSWYKTLVGLEEKQKNSSENMEIVLKVNPDELLKALDKTEALVIKLEKSVPKSIDTFRN
jgi:hypothetical protein